MLACRFFIGLPEVRKSLNRIVSSHLFQRLHFIPVVRIDSPFAHIRSSEVLSAVYLLSCWYTKKVDEMLRFWIDRGLLTLSMQELAVRSAVLYAGTDIANAFGAVRAYLHLSNRSKIVNSTL